jgi:hypothetical protein
LSFSIASSSDDLIPLDASPAVPLLAIEGVDELFGFDLRRALRTLDRAEVEWETLEFILGLLTMEVSILDHSGSRAASRQSQVNAVRSAAALIS